MIKFLNTAMTPTPAPWRGEASVLSAAGPHHVGDGERDRSVGVVGAGTAGFS